VTVARIQNSIRWQNGEINLCQVPGSVGSSSPLAHEQTVCDYDLFNISNQKADWIKFTIMLKHTFGTFIFKSVIIFHTFFFLLKLNIF